MDDSVPLYILAARRGSHFINVAFRLLEYLDEQYKDSLSMIVRVIQLIGDDKTDDHTVSLLNINVFRY